MESHSTDCFVVWLLSLSIVILRFNHFVPCVSSLFFLLMANISSCDYSTVSGSIPLLIDMGSFPFLMMMNKGAMNMYVRVFV